MPSENTDGRASRCSRRELLRAGGAAALSAATAGCVATLPPLGRRVRYGRVDVPDPGPPAYRRLVPDPSALTDPPSPAVPGGVVSLVSVVPGAGFADAVGEQFRLFSDVLRVRLDHVGVGFDDYDRVVWYGPAFVGEADVDRAAVRDTLDGTGYERAGAHRGHDVYAREDLPRTVAVGDGAVVFVPEPGGAPDARAVVDALAGATRRYHEADEAFATFSAAVGSYPATWFGMSGVDESDPYVAHATSVTYDDSSVYYVWHRLYPAGESPSKRAFQDDLDRRSRPREALDVDVEIDGRVATVEMRQSHEQFRTSHRGRPSPVPQVTWGVDHDRDAETVTIRHEAGDSIPAERLSVEFAPVVEDGTEPEIDAQFADEHDVVSPGTSLTVDVSDYPEDSPLSNVYLTVYWERDDPGRSVLLRYDPGR